MEKGHGKRGHSPIRPLSTVEKYRKNRIIKEFDKEINFAVDNDIDQVRFRCVDAWFMEALREAGYTVSLDRSDYNGLCLLVKLKDTKSESGEPESPPSNKSQTEQGCALL